MVYDSMILFPTNVPNSASLLKIVHDMKIKTTQPKLGPMVLPSA